MSIDYERLKAIEIAPVEQRYDSRDTILYALGVGLGHDPSDERQLRFVYEENLAALPTMAVVLAQPGFWLKNRQTGVDWRKVLHGEQWLTLHAPIPPAGYVVGHTSVVEIVDKGRDKGALVYSRRELTDRATGKLLATVMQSALCRGDGGFGGPREWAQAPTPHALPDRQPDEVVTFTTRPESALIYRLSGDLNPLHADPAVARSVGFPRPILHGLATFGVAGHALLRAACGYDPTRLERMGCRFASPVFPGETLVTEIWIRESGNLSFRCSVSERKILVLNNGFAELASPQTAKGTVAA